MGLQSDIQTSVADALNTSLLDAAKSITLEKVVNTFNAATNKTSQTSSTYVTRAVIANFTSTDLADTHIEPTDAKIIILQNEISVEPKVNDYILVETIRYKILKVMKDPANVIWKLQCRQ